MSYATLEIKMFLRDVAKRARNAKEGFPQLPWPYSEEATVDMLDWAAKNYNQDSDDGYDRGYEDGYAAAERECKSYDSDPDGDV